jgi:hypothetical protein
METVNLDVCFQTGLIYLMSEQLHKDMKNN